MDGDFNPQKNLDEKLSSNEVLQACWNDTSVFGQAFFPRAYRMPSPGFHRQMDAIMENPANRYVALACFRGSAKTTKARVFAAKRIAYGVSRTILVVSRSQKPHAISTVEWLQSQVEYNRKYANFFQLLPGKKWRPGTGDIEVVHAGLGHTVRIVAAGITGQVRGFNFDDYRPDLILLDDIDDEETVNTPEQREKTGNLVHGAISNSLTPVAENPWSQMVFLQTPLDLQDQLAVAMKDPQWKHANFGCFDEHGESRWPERWSTETLKKMKEGYIARNQLYLWMREMECNIIQQDTAAFRAEWLTFWETLPENMIVYIAIDPAISDAKTADFQAACAIGIHENKVFLMEYTMVKGQDPEDLIASIFRMHLKYKKMGHSVRAVGVETGNYQKSLKWAFDRAQQRNNYHFPVYEIVDRRKKGQRIRDTIRDKAFAGQIAVHRSHDEFLEQYAKFRSIGDGGLDHDDLLDAFAMALCMVNPYETNQEAADVPLIEESYKPLPGNWRGAP